MIDNLGFVYANASGCSTDEHIWTQSKCVSALAEGLGVQMKVFHTSRRTSLGDRVADDLSKGKVELVRQELATLVDISHRVSKILMAWLNSPTVNMELGRDVLMVLKATTGLDVHVGMSYARAAI